MVPPHFTEQPSSPVSLLDRLNITTPQRTVLSNGLTLVTCEDFEADLVSIQVWVRTGSIHEQALPGSGISHYLEHMLFKGTHRRSADQISSAIHDAGGHINAYTSFDRTVYYTDLPASAFDLGVDILADIVLHSRIDPEESEREKSVILREIAMGEDEPDYQVAQALFRLAYQSHPYRYPVIGLQDRFSQITHQDLVKYYRQRYVPENMTVVIVGAIPTQTMIQQVEQHFTTTRTSGSNGIFIPEEKQQISPRKEQLFADLQLTRGIIAYRIPGLFHPDTPAINLLASLLGTGQTSILWHELRDQLSLVHYISCSAWNPGETGLLWISYLCDPQHRQAVEERIEAILNNLESVSDIAERLARTRRQALVQQINGYKTVSGRASRLGTAEVVAGDLNYPAIYLEQLTRITPQAILQCAQRYLVPTSQLICTLEPRQQQAAAAPAKTKRKPQHSDAFTLHTLGNGIRLLLQPRQGYPKVHLRTGLLGGPLLEPYQQRGIGALAATLLTKDAAGQTTYAIHSQLEALGISFRGFAGNNTFGLSLEGLSDDTEVLVQTLGNALLHPTIDPATLQRELKGQIAALEESKDDLVDYGHTLLRRHFFGEAACNCSYLGTFESLANLTPESVRTYLQHRLTGTELVIAVSGDFDASQIKEQLASTLSELAIGGDAPTLIPEPPKQLPATTGRKIEPMPRKQTVVFQAYPDCPVTDFSAMQVGNIVEELLSGLSSRLFNRVREELGLAYFVGASRVINLNCGMFYLYAGIHKDNIETVFDEFTIEIERIRSGGFSDDELQRCKNRLKAMRKMSQQTIGSRAMQQVLSTLYRYPATNTAKFDALIDAITRQHVIEFAQQYLQPQRSLQLVAGDL